MIDKIKNCLDAYLKLQDKITRAEHFLVNGTSVMFTFVTTNKGKHAFTVLFSATENSYDNPYDVELTAVVVCKELAHSSKYKEIGSLKDTLVMECLFSVILANLEAPKKDVSKKRFGR